MTSSCHTILIVDELAAATELAEVVFLDTGHWVEHAATVEEALRYLAEDPPCLVLMDVVLKHSAEAPKARIEAGYHLLHRIREMFPARTTTDKHLLQVVAVTEHATNPEEVVRLLHAGADNVYAKPLSNNRETLGSLVRHCLHDGERDDHSHCAERTRLARRATGSWPLVPEQGARRDPAPTPIGLLYSNVTRGEPLTADSLQALMRCRVDHDLFLNYVAPAHDRDGYAAGRRRQGKYEELVLSKGSAAIVAELVRERRPLRATAVQAIHELGEASRIRVIEKARAAIDLKAGRTGWRCIKTITSIEGTKAYFFDPPSYLRYAVAVPYF